VPPHQGATPGRVRYRVLVEHERQHAPGAAAYEFVAGVVPNDVTKVLVRTEKGDVIAHLTDAPDRRLGQLYWAETRVGIAGSDAQAKDRSRVAYRGTNVAFTCTYFECVSK
jgi:hypothetical protein